MKTILTLAGLIASVSAAGHIAKDPLMKTNFTFEGTEIMAHYAVPDGEGPFPAIIIVP